MLRARFCIEIVLVVLLGGAVVGAEAPPDLTLGDTKGVSRNSTYNLGSTGLRG